MVLPLLDFVRAKPRPDAVLRWEGILVDPIGAILAVLVFHAVVSGDGQFDLGEFVDDRSASGWPQGWWARGC